MNNKTEILNESSFINEINKTNSFKIQYNEYIYI